MKHRKASHIQITADRIFIGVAGGSAAGKTTLCENINRQMAFDRNFRVETISLDSFYKSINKDEVDVAEYNFDHPLALDFDLAYDVLQKLKSTNEQVHVPVYCFINHKRLEQTQLVKPANIILFEGLMAFHDERIRNLLTYKIFINCDDDIRLCRRIKRDTKERGRTIVNVLAQYNRFVKNSFRDFIYPTIAYADLVIPGARNNRISVDFIVQHIKNIAKKKNIFKTAQQTKVVLFGQNQFFDMNVKKDYKDSVVAVNESFLIFPTSDEHRRELDFFFNTLMSQAFNQEYFEQIFIYQFMKIIKSLLRQLIKLKWKEEDIQKIQLISIYQLREKVLVKKEDKPIKIIFVPIIFERQEHLLSYIKPFIKEKHQTVIIINIFCEMLYPNKVYESGIEGLVFLNLYLVANKRRLIEILSANNQNVKKTQEEHKYPRDWLLHNRDLVTKGLKFLSNQFNIKYEPLNQNLLSELIDSQRAKQVDKQILYTYPVQENNLEFIEQKKNRKITQIFTLPQQHPNLCGFYALNNIKQYPNVQNMRNKNRFLKNYMKFTHYTDKSSQTLKYLKKSLFQPLERHTVPILINDVELFPDISIAPLYISENYIINDKSSLTDLSKSLQKLKHNLIHELFLVMGVYSHFFIIRLGSIQSQKVQFIDSINTPINQIMNGVCSIPHATEQDLKKIKNMKTAIETVLQLYYDQTPLEVMLVRLRIDEILGSYEKAKLENTTSKWFEQQYPAKVIQNDLFEYLRDVTEQELGVQYLEKLTKWFEDPIIQKEVVGLDAQNHPLKRFRVL